jgi:hypothetical protein
MLVMFRCKWLGCFQFGQIHFLQQPVNRSPDVLINASASQHPPFINPNTRPHFICTVYRFNPNISEMVSEKIVEGIILKNILSLYRGHSPLPL